jgi:hypothetical protein
MPSTHLQTKCLFLSLLLASQAQVAIGDDANADWQYRRLMHPTLEEIHWEQAGNIMIYSGLTDRQVAVAMEGQFQRIESMMFTGTVVTDDLGEPTADPASGEIITENDGCD